MATLESNLIMEKLWEMKPNTGVIEVSEEPLIEWGFQYDFGNDEFQMGNIDRLFIWQIYLPWTVNLGDLNCVEW